MPAHARSRISGHNEEEKITVEVFAAGEYKIYKEDITKALKNIGLHITSEVHQPAMGSSCPLISNKVITRVTPPGHASLNGGVLSMREAAHAFIWPRNLLVKIDFEDLEAPHLIQLRYKVYGDGMLDAELELCKICHKYMGHCRDCPNRLTKKTSRKAKMEEYSRKIKRKMKAEPRVDGAKSAYTSTNMNAIGSTANVDPSVVACALQRASKNQLLE